MIQIFDENNKPDNDDTKIDRKYIRKIDISKKMNERKKKKKKVEDVAA